MSRPMDLMIVGAQKAGTTSLKEYLGQHPGVATHKQREMMYFVADPEYAQGYEAAATRYFGPGPGPEARRVAKSVGVMFLPEALERLARHSPTVRAVAVLRHPVERAYSAYWYCRKFGWEDRPSFEEGLAAEAERTRAGTEHARHTAYVARGLYATQVQRLYERLGRERVRIVLFDDLARDPAGVCRTLFDFIEVDSGFVPQVDRRTNPGGAARSEWLARILSGAGLGRTARRMLPQRIAGGLKQRLRSLNEAEFSPPAIDPATRTRLLDTFAASNERLAELITRDLVAWSR